MTDLKSLKKLLADGHVEKAFSGISAALAPELPHTEQYKLFRLFDSIDRAQLGLKPLRLALLASSSVEHLADILRLYLAREGFATEIYIAEYNTMYQAVLDETSELYGFNPDVIWFFTNYRDLDLPVAPSMGGDDLIDGVKAELERMSVLWCTVQQKCAAHIIQNNADLPLARPFGHFETNLASGQIVGLREFNRQLPNALPSGASIFDLDYLAGFVGLDKWIDERYWFHSKHAFSLDVIGMVAYAGARLIAGAKGLSRKCLVMDLDNTLWGGVIGDDGIGGIRLGQGSAEGEAFLSFQRYIKALGRRGVILAVSSKNEHDIALEAIRKHPEMALSEEDFSVIVCNWENKADNIRSIAASLNIDPDSMVFVDDSPFERGQVAMELPMVAIPDMPDDPALFIRTLDSGRYFETTTFSDEDRSRGDMYRANAKRQTEQVKFSDLDSFLADLDMHARKGTIDDSVLPRVSQLINKSNQFHLTTTRYSEAEISEMLADEASEGWWFSLSDRFGDNGLISALILLERDAVLHVDTWVMSCRVLSRGMEQFICNHMMEVARCRGVETIQGRYISTAKNALVKNLYEKLAWEKISDDDGGTDWQLPIDQAQPHKIFISDQEGASNEQS